MKKTLFLSLCLLFTVLGMQSCGPDDIKIQSDVKEVLLLNYPQVTSSVRNGIVTLTGSVDSEEKRNDAEELVKKVNDIKSIVNNIEVKQLASDVNKDLSLQEIINTALYGANITTVEVEVKNLVVTLKGEAKKGDQKRILDVVKSAGAKSVVDSIKLK